MAGTPVPQITCQVCDYVAKPQPLEPEQWQVRDYEGPRGLFRILTCPLCSEILNDQEIVEGFFNRIKEGRDLRFH